MRGLLALALLAACNGDSPDMAEYWAAEAGGPAGLMDPSYAEAFERGRVMSNRAFVPSEGLGPTFNTDSCQGCHQAPSVGGSGPRYRDFFLVYRERFDGSLEAVGTNGSSPVRNLYALPPSGHIAEPANTMVYARRQAPTGLGVGLFVFVADEDILANEDILDEDGDGISGRANYEQGRVGRFGVKSQAATLESFNRGAMFNQMGLSSDPLFFEFAEQPDPFARFERGAALEWLVPTAHAQVGALFEPTTDDDGIPDPEMSSADQEDLLVFSTFVAPPKALPLDDASRQGKLLFGSLGCESCHLPSLPSTMGELPAYTDLLIHDMGPDFDDKVIMGLATGREFRTQPLWAVSLNGPYLHDGRADTLHDAIVWHGGEAQPARERYQSLSATDQQAVVAFLRSLGGGDIDNQIMALPGAAAPAAGEPGGPIAGLSEAELERFAAGRRAFDQNVLTYEGLGTHFNADSCRACHRDPVLGGSGGVDVNVIRYGRRDLDGNYEALDANVLPRSVVPGELPARLPDEANVVELRNPPTLFGVGAIDGIAESAILANEDPEDTDGDGISGRARILESGAVGRFGWKANVPSVADFVADALLNENGLTVDPALSDFTREDDGDSHADPEVGTERYDEIAFYLGHLGAPLRHEPADATAAAAGEALFASVGCADCHAPQLDGVPLFSDLLLHDIAPDPMVLVEQDPGVAPTEFRTAPLWGVSESGPWLHDGSAFTLSDAVTSGHFGEATASREAFEALSQTERDQLVAFLQTL